MFNSAVACAFLISGFVHAICPDGYSNLYNGKCFRVYTDKVFTYDEAKARCTTDGGQLASIHSQEENDIIFAAMSSVNDLVWFGLMCDGDFDRHWTDGTPFDYQHFYRFGCESDWRGLFLFQPEYFGKWDYAQMGGNGYYVLCTVNQVVPTGPCELNYSYQEELGMCIRVNPSSTSWDDAESSCQADNAYLMSIHSQEANAYIRRFSLSNGLDESIFIGLHLVDGTDGISSPVWTDNTTLDYRNFNQGMPTSDLGNCMAMETRTIAGDWISVTCDEQTKLPFLCTKAPPCPTTNTFFYDGEIFSPDYPSSPSRAVNCEYFVVGHPNTTVVVKFDEITLVNDDQILLYDGSESTAPIATARAASVGNAYVTRLNNVMRIVYQTGTTTGTRAWHARFTTL